MFGNYSSCPHCVRIVPRCTAVSPHSGLGRAGDSSRGHRTGSLLCGTGSLLTSKPFSRSRVDLSWVRGIVRHSLTFIPLPESVRIWKLNWGTKWQDVHTQARFLKNFHPNIASFLNQLVECTNWLTLKTTHHRAISGMESYHLSADWWVVPPPNLTSPFLPNNII